MLEFVLIIKRLKWFLNPLNAELNPICHLLALLGGATIVVVSRLGVNACKHMSNLTKEPNKDAIPVQHKDKFHSRTGHEGLNKE